MTQYTAHPLPRADLSSSNTQHRSAIPQMNIPPLGSAHYSFPPLNPASIEPPPTRASFQSRDTQLPYGRIPPSHGSNPHPTSHLPFRNSVDSGSHRTGHHADNFIPLARPPSYSEHPRSQLTIAVAPLNPNPPVLVTNYPPSHASQPPRAALRDQMPSRPEQRVRTLERAPSFMDASIPPFLGPSPLPRFDPINRSPPQSDDLLRSLPHPSRHWVNSTSLEMPPLNLKDVSERSPDRPSVIPPFSSPSEAPRLPPTSIHPVAGVSNYSPDCTLPPPTTLRSNYSSLSPPQSSPLVPITCTVPAELRPASGSPGAVHPPQPLTPPSTSNRQKTPPRIEAPLNPSSSPLSEASNHSLTRSPGEKPESIPELTANREVPGTRAAVAVKPDVNRGGHSPSEQTSSPASHPKQPIDSSRDLNVIDLHSDPKGEKSEKHIFECPGCDLTFTRLSALRQHMLSHTGEKPHACDHCGRRFSLASNLRRHTSTKACKVLKFEEVKEKERGSQPAQPLRMIHPPTEQTAPAPGTQPPHPLPVRDEPRTHGTSPESQNIRPIASPPPVVTKKRKAPNGGKPTSRRKRHANNEPRWIPNTLRSFQNAHFLTSTAPFRFFTYKPRRIPNTNELVDDACEPFTRPTLPLHPVRRSTHMRHKSTLSSSSSTSSGSEGGVLSYTEDTEEERNSYDECPEYPYHPSSWTEGWQRLPGPGLLGEDELINRPSIARRWMSFKT